MCAAKKATSEQEPGEGGPLERAAGLSQLRFAVLHSRDAEPGAPAPGRPLGAEGEPGGPGFRQRLMHDYRERQDEKRRSRAPMPAMAPAAAPANNWIPIGPCVVRQGQAANRPAVAGRIAGLAIAAGAARIYAASANGGVWRSDDGGRTWRSTMDAWDLNPTTRGSDSLACGAIAIHPTNPDRVYVGTGEAVGAMNSFLGVGPVRSDDGGANWQTEPTAPGSPSLAGTGFFRLAVDPDDPERVVAASLNGLYRREPVGGGFHWARKRSPIFTSVAVARSGGATTFYAAQQGGPIFSSTDGHAWTQAGVGFPTADVARIALAVQPGNPSVVYALVVKSSNSHLLGVYRLDTGDNTWRQISGAPADLLGDLSQGGQGWYDVAIAVDPNDANRIYLGGSYKALPTGYDGSIYRCAISSSGAGAGLTYSMVATYIGVNVHADIHALEFTPGDSDKLWVGCDGGVFYAANATSGGNFTARNVGLACLTMNHLAIHPSEDAVLFCGTQDNGTNRYTGEEVWLHSDAGDGGFVVINWNDPYKVLRTYITGYIYRTTDGGQTYASWSWAGLPPGHRDNAHFYAPLAGTPPNPAAPAEADIVAFGGRRPWISTDFGSNWQSIPNNSAADDLPSGDQILSLAFASATRLYAGTLGGNVYRLVKSGATWTRTEISAAPLLAGPITDIAVDLADASGDSIYVTLGGAGDYRHVWHYDGAAWQQRSGPSAASTDALLDVQHNAIIVDPAHANHIYAGADIGVWRSTNGGQTWAPFSEGLPDAAVLDIKLHNGRRLIWAATHGRGVYERTLDTTTALGVELYVRDTQLDRGRYAAANNLPDPTRPGQTVRHWAGPDIKVDVPSSAGTYQTPNTQIDCYQFVDGITDGSGAVAAINPASGTVHNRVYVQVHNRGVTPANDVRVMLLLANASAGLPNLPAGYTASVQSGAPINTPSWQTVGTVTLNDLRVGCPQIAFFDLPSSMLPPPASLAGNAHHCLLALLHCPGQDPFTNTTTVVDVLSPSERKAAHKNLHVVQFTGAVPPAAPQWAAIRLHGLADADLLSDLVLNLHGYEGRVRLMIPADLNLVDPIEQSVVGFRQEDAQGFAEWADEKLDQLHVYIDKKLFNPLWCRQMIEAIAKVRGQRMLVATSPKEPAILRRFVVRPDEFYTVFLAIDRPKEAKIGDSFSFTVYQRDAERRDILGGSDYRVQVVPAPDIEETLHLKLWGVRWPFLRHEVVYVRLTDENGKLLTPDQGAHVGLYMHSQQGIEGDLRPMGYHRIWRAFWLRVDKLPHIAAGAVKVTVVARAVGQEARKTDVIRF